MKIEIDSVSSVKKKVSVHIPEDRIQQELSNAIDEAQRKAAIPGFRPGKAPRKMLEQKYGKAIEGEVYKDLVRSSLQQAIEENKLDAITISEMSEPKREIGGGLSYSASIEVRPTIEPKDYKGISIAGADQKVKEEDIENVLTRIRDSHAVLKPKDAQKPELGDYVSMIVEQLDSSGQPTEKTTPAEELHLIGHEHSRKEIDDAILTMNVGDFQEVSLKQEHDHHHEHGENCNHDHGEIKVRLTLKSIKTKVLPEATDEFAKTVGPFENLEGLKKQIREDLEKQLGEKNRVENAKTLIGEILKNNPIDLPDTLVENELVNLRQEMFQHMINSGMTHLPKDFTEEKMNGELRPEAQRRVHEQLMILAIANKENIQVDPSEIQSRIEQHAQALKRPVGEVRKQYAENGRLASVQFQILAQKTLDFLLSQANIK